MLRTPLDTGEISRLITGARPDESGTEPECGPLIVALVCHWPREEPFWLQDALSQQGFTVTRFSRPWGRRRHRWLSLASRFETMLLGWRVARFAAKHNAAIVADSDGHVAGLFSAISLLPIGRHSPPVLCSNLLLFDKPGLRTYLRKRLYWLALANPATKFTVSSSELQTHYAQLLRAGLDRFVVLPDCYSPHHRSLAQHDPMHDGGYVFVGGDAARDWDTAIEAARLCSDIPFLFVAFSKRWRSIALPPNVDMRFDVPLRDFHEMMRNSRLIVVTLRNDVITAGLLVVTRGALMGCPVIATSTPAIDHCFPPECGDLLVPMSDAVTLARRIRRLWNDAAARQLTAERLREFVLEHHSPEAYAAEIGDLIRPR